jgi:hypothetical protein
MALSPKSTEVRFADLSRQSFLNHNDKKFCVLPQESKCPSTKKKNLIVHCAPKKAEKMFTVLLRKRNQGYCFLQTLLKSLDPVVPSPSAQVQIPIHPTQQYMSSSEIFWVDGAQCPSANIRKMMSVSLVSRWRTETSVPK